MPAAVVSVVSVEATTLQRTPIVVNAVLRGQGLTAKEECSHGLPA